MCKSATSEWRPFSEAPKDGKWIMITSEEFREEPYTVVRWETDVWLDEFQNGWCDEDYGTRAVYCEIYPPEDKCQS